jgi:hypothetical protein
MADDYSNTTSTTGTLSPGGSRTGKLETAGDADWFRIALTEGRYYTFEMTSSSATTSNNQLALYDVHGSYVGAAYGSYSSNTVKYTFKAASSAAYYVSVSDTYSSGSVPASYTLKASQGVADDIGDTRFLAKALALGQSQSAVFEGSSDVDYFKVTLAAGVTYTVTPSWNPNGVAGSFSGYLRLEDASGASISSFSQSGSQSFTTTSAGDYYIAASNSYGPVTNYKLQISAATDDFTASKSGAGTLAVGTTTGGKLDVVGDRDWFATTLAADTTYWFKLGAGTDGTPIYSGSGILKVFDGDGNVVATSAYSYIDTSRQLVLQYVPTKAGTYYLEVSDNGYNTGKYTVRAEIGEKDDYGDTQQAAATVTTGNAVTGKLAIPMDRDVFKVAVTAGKTYVIELNAKDATGSALLSLAGATDTGYSDTIVTYNKAGVTEYRVLTAVKTGDYYLAISNSRQTGSIGYTLQVSEPAHDDYATGAATAGVLAVDSTITGQLDYTGDIDTFKVTLQYGAKYAFQLRGSNTGAGTLAVDNRVLLQIAGSDPSNYESLTRNQDGIYTFTSKQGGDYYLSVRPSAYGSIDGDLTGSYTLTALALNGDTTAPTLVSHSPKDHVGLADNITLHFSEAIMRGYGNTGYDYITLRDSLGVIVESYSMLQDSRVTINGSTLTINPTLLLKPDSKYFISLPNGTFSDLAGNEFAADALLTIRTVETVDTGSAGNDFLVGLGLGLKLVGGTGIDTAIYGYSRSTYDIAKTASGTTVASRDWANTSKGSDTLDGIERLMFSDTSIALDIDGAGGQAYRMYQAAFNRAPDKIGLGFWMANMDKGMGLLQVAGGFLDSPEFAAAYGNATNAAFVEKLYGNVLHRAPDQAGFDHWMELLGSGTSRAQVLMQFSESAENQAAVLKVIGNGFEYTPYG